MGYHGPVKELTSETLESGELVIGQASPDFTGKNARVEPRDFVMVGQMSTTGRCLESKPWSQSMMKCWLNRPPSPPSIIPFTVSRTLCFCKFDHFRNRFTSLLPRFTSSMLANGRRGSLAGHSNLLCLNFFSTPHKYSLLRRCVGP